MKNWCFWTVVLEKTPESPLDCKEIQPVHSEGNQPWVFFGGTDAKAEAPVVWPPHVKSWLIGKDSDAGGVGGTGDRRRRGWQRMRWLDGINQWTWVWVNSRNWWWQGSLACCDSWVCKESDTERLSWNELNWTEPGLWFTMSYCLVTSSWNSNLIYSKLRNLEGRGEGYN